MELSTWSQGQGTRPTKPGEGRQDAWDRSQG